MPAEISVIVPTLNEGPNIDPLLERLFSVKALQHRVEVIIADDNSTDDTAARVEAWARSHPVKLVQRQGPPDLSASVIAGAQAAAGKWAVVMDADGSHPADRVPELIESLERGRCDIVVGSRHVRGGAIEQWPWYRRALSRLASLLAWPYTDVRDPMSGFFACARERLTALPVDRAGYKILLELLVRSEPPPRVSEIPIHFHDREHGESKLGLLNQWIFLQRLAALGGARLTVGNASKFGLVGLSGVLVDLLLFQVLIVTGLTLAGAHMSSFAAATVTNFVLNYRWTFSGDFPSGQSVVLRYGRFLAVALLALMLRGGVLAALVQGLGVPPALAIIPAIIVTAGINYLGSIFYVFPTGEARSRARIRWRLAALALIAYLIALRALYLGLVDLIPDEAYYWVYTLHPALSYLDHPPLTAWLIGLATQLAGATTFGVRLPVLLLAPLGAWFAYLFGRDMIDKSAGIIASCLFCAIPAFFAAGLLMVPDSTLIVAWMAALYFFQRALIKEDGRAFLGLGVAMGAGLLAKYSILLLAPAALLFMLTDARARRWFKHPEPYLGALLAALMFLPVLIWNWQHEGASFFFQLLRRPLADPTFSVHMIAVYGFLMLAPPAAIAILYALGPVRGILVPDERHRRFMLVMALVPLAIFALYGLFSVVKFHWTVPVWLALLPLIAATILPNPAASRRPALKALNRLWGPLLVVKAVFFGLVLHYFALGLPGAGWTDGDTGYLGWPETAEVVYDLVGEIERETGKRPLIAGTTKWSVAAALTFHYPEQNPGNITSRNLIGRSASQWEAWFEPDTDPSRPVILINYEPKLIEEAWLGDVIVELGPLQSRAIYREGRHIRTLYYRVGLGFDSDRVRRPDW